MWWFKKKDNIQEYSDEACTEYVNELKQVHKKYRYSGIRDKWSYYRLGVGVPTSRTWASFIDHVYVDRDGDIAVNMDINLDDNQGSTNRTFKLDTITNYDKEKDYIEGFFSTERAAKSAYAQISTKNKQERIKQLEYELNLLKGNV